jgi:transposase-like protein
MSDDLKGRARRDYWQSQIDAWQSSGQSQQAFCRVHDLNYPQFVYWRRKFRQSATPSSAKASSGFVSVVPTMSAVAGGLSLVLPNGVELRGIETANLDVVLRLLGRLS